MNARSVWKRRTVLMNFTGCATSDVQSLNLCTHMQCAPLLKSTTKLSSRVTSVVSFAGGCDKTAVWRWKQRVECKLVNIMHRVQRQQQVGMASSGAKWRVYLFTPVHAQRPQQATCQLVDSPYHVRTFQPTHFCNTPVRRYFISLNIRFYDDKSVGIHIYTARVWKGARVSLPPLVSRHHVIRSRGPRGQWHL